MDVRPKCIRCRRYFTEQDLEPYAAADVCFGCIMEILLLLLTKLNSVHFIPVKTPPAKINPNL